MALNLVKYLEDWLLNSEIRVKAGENEGAFYGWKNLNGSELANRYPYIYNEVTGYALSCFSYLYSVTNSEKYLFPMKQTMSYLTRNMTEGLFFTGKRLDINFKDKGIMENQIYSFDNGMILSGLLNYHKVTSDGDALLLAKKLASGLIDNFFDDGYLKHALLDTRLLPMDYAPNKWSTHVGSYHAKLGIGFFDLYQLTGNESYLTICKNLCNLAAKLQNTDGSIHNNLSPNNELYLHPHLYACEGLTYVGSHNQDNEMLHTGLRGIKWSISMITQTGGVPRSTVEKIDQADCTSQLLRLVIINGDGLRDVLHIPQSTIDSVKDVLLKRLSKFYIQPENAIRYNDRSHFACTWCTMFTLQALLMYFRNLDCLDLNVELFV